MAAKFDDEELIDDLPDTADPYTVLGVEKTATPEQIKTAYRKAALIHHPDKAQPENKDTAHQKFQEIAFAYAILSDPHRRQRYDTTGRTEESLDPDDASFNWATFYRSQFENVITAASIATFKSEYQASAEEQQALFAAYESHAGDMDKIYEVIMLSDPRADDARFRTLLDTAIANGELPDYPKYTKESAKAKRDRLKRAERDGKEARALARELGVEDKLFGDGRGGGSKAAKGEDALAALIKQRQKSRGNFFDNLEAKYAPAPKARGGKKRASPAKEPSEEAFAKNRAQGKKSKIVDAGEDEESVASASRRSKRTKR